MIQETSRIAYRHDVLPTLGQRQKKIYETLELRDSFTNSELAHYLGWTINTVTPRIFELRKLNLVTDSGKRTCRITGRTAIAWRIVQDTLF